MELVAVKRILLALLLLVPAPLWAQQPVTITNVQAVDYTHDAALSLGTTSGPLLMCRTSAARPTVSSGDTRAFAVWCNQYGAIHAILTDNAGNPADVTTPYYLTSAASTNATSVKASAGTLHMVHLTNTTATTYYLRLYNLAAAPTCSSATGFIKSIPVMGTSANGYTLNVGETFGTGIAFCFTGGGSSTDNTNAATGVYIGLSYR
jgi:hypothetical protein